MPESETQPVTPLLSVVVPAYNEAENLPTLTAEIIAAVAPLGPFELLLVDDGSTDDTVAVARQLAAEHAEVRALAHHHNAGQSAGVWTGVQAARAPLVATLDGDGQNDPASIPDLYERYRAVAPDTAGDLIVCGIRTTRKDSFNKRISSRVANAVRRRLLDDEVTDTGCGLKLFPRGAFLALPAFNHMHRFLPALFKAAGSRIESVPVHHRPRTRGVSKYGMGGRLWVGLFDLVGVKWLMKRRLHRGYSLSSGREPWYESSGSD